MLYLCNMSWSLHLHLSTPAGMAEDGYLPECFARRSRFDTPWSALLLITALVLVLSLSSSFSSLISMLNAVYCVAQAQAIVAPRGSRVWNSLSQSLKWPEFGLCAGPGIRGVPASPKHLGSSSKSTTGFRIPTRTRTPLSSPLQLHRLLHLLGHAPRLLHPPLAHPLRHI